MNNAKLWLVVKPTTGIPIFLSAVAIGSFAVHVAVLSNTTWVSDFLSGRALGSGDMKTAEATQAQTPKLAAVETGRVLASGAREVEVTLPDGRTTFAIIEGPTVLARSDTAGLRREE